MLNPFSFEMKMGKIALFLPDDKTYEQAIRVLDNSEYNIDIISRVDTKKVIETAKEVISDGAEIIIARGNQAMYIKENLTIPVVDIRATGQEVGLLLTKAKELSAKFFPKVLMVVNKNVLPDMSRAGEMYGIDLNVYTVHSTRDVPMLVQRIAESNPDVLIGGSNVIEAAKSFGIKTVYFTLTEDSLREAFRVANMLKYVMDVEKKNTAQMKALLENAFTGILRIDRMGKALFSNELMKNILHRKESEIKGRSVIKLLPDMEEQIIRRLLEKGGEPYSTYVIIRDQAVNLIMTPVIAEGENDGAIIFCYPVKQIQKQDSVSTNGMQNSTNTKSYDDILHNSEKMQECLHLARTYMLSTEPILIVGESGTEKRELAEVLYNNSVNKTNVFFAIDCSALDEHQQEEAIFGNACFSTGKEELRGGIEKVGKGVLLLENIEFLSSRNQAVLNKRIQYGIDGRIFATATTIQQNVVEGNFNEELYWKLSGLMVRIPPLRDRPEDLEKALEKYFSSYCIKYNRHFSLTQNAKKYLLKLSWNGNFTQLKHVCERLVLTSDVRMLSEDFVRTITNNVIPKIPSYLSTNIIQSEEQIIRTLLEKHHGDRQKIADEMGISKVTLWRKMKAFELE